jgi:trigger factor
LAEIKVETKPGEVGEKQVTDVLDSLRKMQPKEVAKTGAATKEDKMVINMEMFLDKIPVEGGQAPNHQVYLSEPHYIPGLAEKLVGLKPGEEKEFPLKFPVDHYQKHLAGKDIDFKIKVKDVFELQYADLNDEFAKKLGQESLTKLKEILLTNLTSEAELKESQRVDAGILEQMIEKATFDELPQILVDSEKRKMFYELKHDLENRGANFEDYLKSIKKSEEEIFNDFTEGGTKRAKAALISREVAKEYGIKVEKPDLDKELDIIKKAYPGDEKVEANLKKPEVIDTIAATIQNRKVVELLREKVLPKAK